MAAESAGGNGAPRKVGIFVTCLANLLRPSIARATVELVRRAGCEPVLPGSQTCCGQPAYNSGLRKMAASLAAKLARDFSECDTVVVPSGSCAGMVHHHYPQLAADAGGGAQSVREAAGKFVELSQFLEGAKCDFGPAQDRGPITYHDSCAGLRELGVKQAPRKMLEQKGYRIVEMAEPETCCGFGGTFCVKFPEISCALADDKCRQAAETGVPTVVMGDLGCMLHLEGRLSRTGEGRVRFVHLAEALAA